MGQADTERRGYAVGIQDFDRIRESGAVYVDKTEYVWKMATTKAVNFFLSRPRHFGKSLLVDTLRCYFEGRKDMYDGYHFKQFIEAVRRWYVGIPYSITDKNQNGRSSECHQACLNGRVVTDEDEVNEQLYQSLIYAALMGYGADVTAEVQTSDGRMDIVLKLPNAIYIIELKYGKTAEEAVGQILSKDYAVRFAAERRPVWAVGLNISQDRRTIDDYRVVKV